ncbi:unnamed protein product [Mytilus coruscus]|uniref:Uncharacterized protein n=1 Tax=Mytilus coruscus TaxID=42192 RepID=A0A6J8C2V9_MYTCO|nr:unnamed protein product [Mytilus coruscus]
MTDLNEYLEETIDNIGGLGPFQWILILLLFGSNISDNWSNLMMAFGAAVPNWRCDLTTLDALNFTKSDNISDLKICEFKDSYNSVLCKRRLYDPGMNTVVSEQIGTPTKLYLDNQFVNKFNYAQMIHIDLKDSKVVDLSSTVKNNIDGQDYGNNARHNENQWMLKRTTSTTNTIYPTDFK